MTKHRLAHYRDGHVLVEFCKVCGAEGAELIDPCPGELEFDPLKPVDKQQKTS